MSCYFNEKDRELLKRLSEEELYALCCKLMEVATEAKRCITRVMFGRDFIRERIQLAETAASEVARREGYKSKPSDGEYSFGATYDTEEFRQWIIKHRGVTADEKFFNDFSFAEILKRQ